MDERKAPRARTGGRNDRCGLNFSTDETNTCGAPGLRDFPGPEMTRVVLPEPALPVQYFLPDFTDWLTGRGVYSIDVTKSR